MTHSGLWRLCAVSTRFRSGEEGNTQAPELVKSFKTSTGHSPSRGVSRREWQRHGHRTGRTFLAALPLCSVENYDHQYRLKRNCRSGGERCDPWQSRSARNLNLNSRAGARRRVAYRSVDHGAHPEQAWRLRPARPEESSPYVSLSRTILINVSPVFRATGRQKPGGSSYSRTVSGQSRTNRGRRNHGH